MRKNKSIVSMLAPLAVLAAVFMAGVTTSCNRLSRQAKEMVGYYYIPELDETTPVMELNKNGKCVIRNIRPGVASVAVEGRWNVKDDSLIAKLDTTKVTVEGDSSLVGNIPPRMARKIVDFTGLTLTLEGQGGVAYMFQRRYR